jgi:hypothetical protein
VPLTLSHPAAVLPLRRLPFLAELPLAPMVIASMVPDVPMFVPGRGGYGLTHSLLGVVTVDVLATLVLLLLWDRLVRDALVDLSPGRVRDRFSRSARLRPSQWLLAPVAAVAGALTHVVWDAFTHPGRWGVDDVAWLRDDHLGLAGHRWAQYLSGVLGLAVVVAASVRHVHSRSIRETGEPRLLPAAVLPLLVATLGTCAGLDGLSRLDQGLHEVAFHTVVSAIQLATVGLALVCSLWGLLELRRTIRRGPAVRA